MTSKTPPCNADPAWRGRRYTQDWPRTGGLSTPLCRRRPFVLGGVDQATPPAQAESSRSRTSTSCHQRYRRRLEQQDPEGERNRLRLPQSRALQDGNLLPLWWTGSVPQTGRVILTSSADHKLWGLPTLKPEERQKNCHIRRSSGDAPDKNPWRWFRPALSLRCRAFSTSS